MLTTDSSPTETQVSIGIGLGSGGNEKEKLRPSRLHSSCGERLQASRGLRLYMAQGPAPRRTDKRPTHSLHRTQDAKEGAPSAEEGVVKNKGALRPLFFLFLLSVVLPIFF